MKIVESKMPKKDCEAPGLVFPCTIGVKIFIHNQQEIELLMKEFVVSHLGEKDLGEWKSRTSSGDKYLAITVEVKARDRAHIDKFYQALTDHEHVIMTL